MVPAEIVVDAAPVSLPDSAKHLDNYFSVASGPSCDTSTNSSVDTQDALLDLLGISVPAEKTNFPLTAVLTWDHDENDDNDNDMMRQSNVVISISLPPRCSRHLIPNPVAVHVEGLLSKDDCHQLVKMACNAAVMVQHGSSQSTGFQYVTEATHTASDGTTFTVPIQSPNPHQLSIVHAPCMVDLVWNRLQPLLLPVSSCLSEKYSNDSTSTSAATSGHHHWMHPVHQRFGRPLGLNPKLRVLQYQAEANDRFEPHFDATTVVGAATSRLTVLIYLNDGGGDEFQGGETHFLDARISAASQGRRKEQDDDDASKITPMAGTAVIFDHDLYHAGLPLRWGTKYVLRTDVLFATNDGRPCEAPGDSFATKSHHPRVDGRNKTDNQHHELKESTAAENSSKIMVSHVCDELKLRTQDLELLDELGLLHVTLESFLVPGAILLRQMLVEQGIEQRQVEALLQRAEKIVFRRG